MKKTLIFLLAILLLIGCGSQEEKARTLYNHAITAERAGDRETARELYEKIIKKYPSTEISVQVNEMLGRMDAMSSAAEKVTQDIRKQTIEQALMLYKLDNGEYPTTEQGLSALLSPPTTGRPARGWRQEGYIEKTDLLNHVASYTFQPGGSPEIVMK